MPREQIPITPALVTWARERAGLSLDEAAQTFSRIREWELGESSPTYAQLEHLADRLKLPIAVFFFPAPPNVPPIQETFRTLPDAEFQLLPSRIRLLLRKAKAFQLNLAEMTEGRNPAERLITRDLQFAPDVPIERMAQQVRDYLRVPLVTQTGWASDEEALKEWRAILIGVGVFVFKDAFKTDAFSGFCLYDTTFPIIYVNNTSAKTRQIFTLFHELAHLLFLTSGVDKINDDYLPRLRGDARQIEILCNRFAAQLLVPDNEFDAALRGKEINERSAEELAAFFHVSRESIFRRFLDRELIDEAQYQEAAARWAAQQQGGGPGGDYYWTKLAYLGREYVALALKQFHQNRIDEVQLAEYLDTKPKNVESLERYFERGGV